MKDDSTDQLVLLAQMMADDDSSGLRFVLARHVPLIIIVTVGLAVALLAIFATRQWEAHVENIVSEAAETIYFNQVSANLKRIKRNTNVLEGFIISSEFVSPDEFNTFSDTLLSNQDATSFIYMTGYPKDSGQNYLRSVTPSLRDDVLHFLQMPATRERMQSLHSNASDVYFAANSNGNDAGFIVHARLLTAPDYPDGLLLLSGIREQDVISGSQALRHNVEVTVTDDRGGSAVYNPLSAVDPEQLHRTSHAFENLQVNIAMERDFLPLDKMDYFKWVLIAFCIIFTILLSIQFVFAQRSIRRLANLAVQRANDLTSINSELTEEIISRVHFQAELMRKTVEIQDANKRLAEVQNQLIQQEKLASLGQLAAGVAHEINNPVGFINSNLAMLKKYTERALQLMSLLDEIAASTTDESLRSRIDEQKNQCKYSSLQKNMKLVIEESQEGVDRVKQIVQDLKDFSRIDEAEWQWADLHAGIDSTLNIAWNELKYKAVVHKEYGELPLVECVPSQINQVILNLLVNSAQAMETSGNIYIRTRHKNDTVEIEVEDDGCGMPENIINKIFDPFFTTKEVGKGTGLGLSLSYGIVQKHHGSLTVKSQPGVGTTFLICLPVTQKTNEKEVAANV